MATTPTFALPPSFLGTSNRDPNSRFTVAGVPFDLGTTNRPGARLAPNAIRAASRMLVDGENPANWRDPSAMGVADMGDFAIALGDIPASLELIEAQAAAFNHLITLGGDHTITLPLLRALTKRLGGPVGLVHFDAHVDTWPDNFGQVLAHGSVLWHVLEEGLVDPACMVQIGIRSPVQRAISDWAPAKGVTVITAEDVHLSSPAAVADRIKSIVGGGPTYLSFDIDALDPSCAPGTGTPEVGGLFTWQSMGILKRLGGINWAGMDVVEVAPPFDHAEVTALAAASVAWTYLSLMT
ncbi:MAG: agmatinase [Rhodospirillaceae bacterium]|nr:agmatinase [Rhodospirillales bacterium]